MAKPLDLVSAVIQATLEKTGFVRRSRAWYRASDEVVEVVSVQKSQYGQQFYLNYGLWLRALGEESHPKEEKCHIRMRVGAIVSSEEELGALLNLESQHSTDEREMRLKRLLESEFLPIADGFGSVQGIRRALQTGGLRRAMIHVAAKTFLTTPPL